VSIPPGSGRQGESKSISSKVKEGGAEPRLPEGWDVRRESVRDELRLVVLASGSGSNLEAILEACGRGEIHAEVVCVVSNNPTALALVRAREHGVSAVALDHRGYGSRVEHEAAILERVAELRPQVAVLAGYMRLVTPFFLEAFRDPETGRPGVINIHPADTRAYQGTHGYEFALGLLGGSKRLDETKVTVHFVDEGMDTGPIIKQARVAVRPDDDLESLKKRGLAVEHRLFPEVIDLLARDRLRLENGRVEIV
jgi:phosphoribosylglycinamide formyltransferase-1